jgi:octaprenyl-diphosphate synthase
LNLKKISGPIINELEIFQKKFSDTLKSKVALVDLITRYILRQKGKKIRPILVLLSAKVSGDLNERTYVAAILVELLHTATLIHDDVVDDAKTRRGLTSINSVWKNKAAVLFGDYLLAKGLLNSLENKEFEFLLTTSEAVKRMSEGELLQIQKARNFDATEQTYFKVISDKTASLIKTCCKLGALSATNNKEKIDNLAEFGENLGMAFQLRDDLLDYIGRKKLLGKSTGNDLKEKKFTLPLVISLKNSPPAKAKEIMKLIKSSSKKKFEQVYNFVSEFGGLDYTQEKIIQYANTAKLTLDIFPDSDAKTSLDELVQFISLREY